MEWKELSFLVTVNYDVHIEKERKVTYQAKILSQTRMLKKYKMSKAKNKWLCHGFNSMTTKIGKGFFIFSTTSEIWEEARETYSNQENMLKSFELEGKLHKLRQGDIQVTHYLTEHSLLWQLNTFERHK